MSGPRILVFAYSGLGHACLKFLLDRGEHVIGLYTYRPLRGERIWFSSAEQLARERNVQTRLDVGLDSPKGIAGVRRLEPELMFSFYYRDLLPRAVLELPRLGAFNMHGSLLPKYRGRAPVNWAVLHGEKETGATLHAMTERADAGEIVDQEPVLIGPDDTAAQVQARVTAAALGILESRIEELKSGTAPHRSQDESQATKFGRRRPEDGRIDWNRPARDIHNLVRSVSHPYPGAFTDALGPRMFVWQSRVLGRCGRKRRPGMPETHGEALYVACGDGRDLKIVSAQIEGGEQVSGGKIARQILNGKQAGRARS